MARIDRKEQKKHEDIDYIRQKRFTHFRDRLINVRIPGRHWTLLEKQTFFVCGYCSQRMALYSPFSLTGREENPKLFYGCHRRCAPSNIHRYQFIDGKILKFIYNRIKGFYTDFKGDPSLIKPLESNFKEIEKMDERRGFLLELLSHAGFNRDNILRELIDIEEKTEKLRDRLSGIHSKHPEKSELFAPIFLTESFEEMQNYSLSYRRELVMAAIKRIRFFNETLIIRVTPLTEEEKRLDTEGHGKIFNIHLAFDPDRLKIDSIIEGKDDFDEQELSQSQRIDLDFIMSENEPMDEYAEYSRSTSPVDVELLMTEPGSSEEKEVLKKRKKTKNKE